MTETPWNQTQNVVSLSTECWLIFWNTFSSSLLWCLSSSTTLANSCCILHWTLQLSKCWLKTLRYVVGKGWPPQRQWVKFVWNGGMWDKQKQIYVSTWYHTAFCVFNNVLDKFVFRPRGTWSRRATVADRVPGEHRKWRASCWHWTRRQNYTRPGKAILCSQVRIKYYIMFNKTVHGAAPVA